MSTQSPTHITDLIQQFLLPLLRKDTASLDQYNYLVSLLVITSSVLLICHSEIVKKVLLGSCTDPNMALQFCYKALMLMELYTSQNGRHW